MNVFNTKRSLIGLLSACLLASGAYWMWQNAPARMVSGNSGSALAAKTPDRPATAVVAKRDIHFAITAASEIGPLDAVSVRPEIGGLISKLTLDIGHKIKKGDVLFELDDKELQTEKTSRQTEIAGASLAVETQRLLLEKSKLNFERLKQLLENKLVAQEVFDNGRLDFALAQNSLSIASNRLETARTALQQVEDKLLKTLIRAPFDCTILARPVSVGQPVSGASGYNSGTEVFTVANLADMIITAHINQSDVTRVNVGQAVKVEVNDRAGQSRFGKGQATSGRQHGGPARRTSRDSILAPSATTGCSASTPAWNSWTCDLGSLPKSILSRWLSSTGGARPSREGLGSVVDGGGVPPPPAGTLLFTGGAGTDRRLGPHDPGGCRFGG